MIFDLRLAFRTLRKSPGFTLAATGVLALGIGANTAVFSVINQLLLKPPGISEPERVVAIRVNYDKIDLTSIAVSAPNFADVRDSRLMYEHSAIVQTGDFNYTGGSLPERLEGSSVSVEWFNVHGAQPRLGRVFRPEEDQPEANYVVVLAHAAWQRLFGGDPSAVGRMIELNHRPYEIIGVMSPDFRFPQVDLWVPLGLPGSAFEESNRFNERYFCAARLKPGVSLAQSNAFLNLLADRVRNNGTSGGQYAQDSKWGLFAVPIANFIARDAKTPLLAIFGAVGLVLLIACSNVAGLMLARASSRGRDTAVRIALGARGWQLLRHSMAESLLLASAGAAAGLALAYGSIELLLQLAPETIPAGIQASIDPQALLFTAAATTVSVLLFGLTPAIQLARLDPYEILKSAGRSATAGGQRQRLRAALVATEAGLALVLLIGAGLFIRSFVSLQEVNPGFEPKGVMTATLSLPNVQYSESGQRVAFYRALIDRLAALPGVQSAGLGTPLPFSGGASSASFSINGRERGPGDPGPHGHVRYVSPGYFETLGIPLKRGTLFTNQDRADTQPVVVIDENLARQYWPNEDPIGKQMRRGGNNTPWSTVAGVVGHVKHSDLAGDEEKGTYYYSVFQQTPPFASVVVKTSSDPSDLAAALRGAVLSVDPKQAVHNLRTMDAWISNSLATRELATRLMGFFAVAALMMAALGLYGVISYTVLQRTQELGIRMALGAQRRSVVLLVVGQGLRLAGIGAIAGLAVAAALSHALESQLFGVAPLDPLTFSATVVVLLAAAALASFLPARRAAKVDPLRALRYE